MNVAERVGQVRAAKARVKEMEDEFAESIKDLDDFIKLAEAELLQYLNSTGQKSAATAEGTAYWAERVSYRVADKDEFKRHVIGTEQWELITFAAAGTACEEFTKASQTPPPGVTRHAERKVHVIAPSKPRTKKTKQEEAQPVEEEIESMT
jgi:hypothetical protein